MPPSRAQAKPEISGLAVNDAIRVDRLPVLIMPANAVSARLIDRDTGAVPGELPLAELALPSDELPAMPDSVTPGIDVPGHSPWHGL